MSEVALVDALRLQRRLSLALATVIVATCALVAWLANGRSFQAWVQDQRLRDAAANNTPYLHAGTFNHVGSKILLDEFATSDYTPGGVCLVGSSALRSAVQVWDLPADMTGLVHNIGFPAATQLDQIALLQYLVRQRGLGSQHPEKTLVVFVLFFGNAVPAGFGRLGRLFPEFIRWQQIYTYDRGALRPKAMLAPARWLAEQQVRCADLLNVLADHLAFADGHFVLPSELEPRGPHDPATHRQNWRQMMGRDWQLPMDRQTAMLTRGIAALRERGIEIALCLQPIASWHRGGPFATRYAELVARMADELQIELLDLSELLPDEQFYDATHFDFAGSRRVHDELMKIARPFLERVGLID